MFELIKFFVNVRRDERFLRGAKLAGLYTGNNELVKQASESLEILSRLKEKVERLDIKTAKKYNSNREIMFKTLRF